MKSYKEIKDEILEEFGRYIKRDDDDYFLLGLISKALDAISQATAEAVKIDKKDILEHEKEMISFGVELSSELGERIGWNKASESQSNNIKEFFK